MRKTPLPKSEKQGIGINCCIRFVLQTGIFHSQVCRYSLGGLLKGAWRRVFALVSVNGAVAT